MVGEKGFKIFYAVMYLPRTGFCVIFADSILLNCIYITKQSDRLD